MPIYLTTAEKKKTSPASTRAHKCWFTAGQAVKYINGARIDTCRSRVTSSAIRPNMHAANAMKNEFTISNERNDLFQVPRGMWDNPFLIIPAMLVAFYFAKLYSYPLTQ